MRGTAAMRAGEEAGGTRESRGGAWRRGGGRGHRGGGSGGGRRWRRRTGSGPCGWLPCGPRVLVRDR